MKRRSFLQQTGLLLAAWGTSQVGLALAVDRSRQVLAQSTHRKLALLIGINQYRSAALQGCLTDVDLQRELLIHRFGFQPSDILTLTDQQATRSQIETAFIEHLVNPSKAGDVIVFHFSGHGSLLNLGGAGEDAQTSLVTIDDPASDADSIVNRLPEETLLLLLKSLPTDQVTTILDAGYADIGATLQGNLRIRSQPMPSANHLQDAEIVFQAQRLEALKLNRTQLRGQRQAKQIPGVILGAANSNQFAGEARWNGFNAGLLTYALTQQLWQSTPATTLRVVLSRAAAEIGQRAHQQQPSLEGQKSHDRPLTPYHLPVSQVSADGVVIRVAENGKAGQIWLAGLSPQVLEQSGVDSLMMKVETSSQLQIFARDGLIAKARLLSSLPDETLTVGQWVQEAVRIIPRNLGLSVALDSTLERIERVDAVSAFSAIPHLSAAPAGEQPADYLFGKVSANTQVAALPSAPIVGLATSSGYGLFSQGREMISSTAGEAGEAVKVAVKRLAPQLQTLLTAKLLRLTVNERSSRLAVRATLKTTAPQSQILIEKRTDRAPGQSDQTLTVPLDGKMPTVAIGTRIQYRIQNDSQQPIYGVLIGLDSSGSAFAFHTVDATLQTEETLTVPAVAPTFEWVVQSPIGLTETHLICSRAPLRQTQTLLAETFKQNSEPGTIRPLPNSLEVAQAVLQDLHQASQSSVLGATGDTYALSVNAWATFRFSYQVV
ncbi:peptidase C14 [Phormidesmis priestleyi ULC007]|uniref:Peptidase C14 n=1 Tax=Phormidesmis priestleyi ULC007 TaxID=1920490 RepID=A0A2T1DL01_9CYAN|nr:caspase family protein [Phormidesmis priestleyi]PSB21153.1 peptidase C14 [Phormidesmis priestleyi ULC007]PZO51322.1 MAG: DUF4384 domain-containing protein [Phormidesmis priestleyi]